jgi:hypothetical protein
MPAAFDPYDEWLDISPEEQPADHYRLLGLARFETDAARIAAAADERMARLRTFQTGPRGAYTQKLLNELAAARVTLLDAAGKAAYDGKLAASLSQLEAARRAQAPRPVTQAPAAPPQAPPSPVRAAAKPTAGWQVPLLVGACVLAIGLATGGFGLSRLNRPDEGRASQPKQGRAKSVKPQTSQGPIVTVDSEGGYECLAGLAVLTGELDRFASAGGDTLGPWNAADDEAAWRVQVVRPGFFQAQVTYAGTAAAEGTALEIRVGNRARRLSLRDTGGLSQFETDSLTVALERNGLQSIALRVLSPKSGEWLRLRSIRLVPLGSDGEP